MLLATPDNTLISDLIRNSTWSLPNVIPENVRLAICDIPIHEDFTPCLSWGSNNHSKHSDFLIAFYSSNNMCSWFNLIWHRKYVLRYSVFAWLALVGGLKTADALLIRNIHVQQTCSLCHVFSESVSHLFFECSYSYGILLELIPASRQLLFRPSILQLLEWIMADPHTAQLNKNYFSLIACCSIYYIWKERNSRRFGNSSNSSSTITISIKKAVYHKSRDWKQ